MAQLLASTTAVCALVKGQSQESDTKACLFMNPPSHIGHKIGELFNASVEIASVQNLRSVEFSVAYNNTVLDVTEVTQGAFFPTPPRSNFIYEKNGTTSSIKVIITLKGAETPLSGNGSLAFVTFKVVSASYSCSAASIDLVQTALWDSALIRILHDSVGAVYFWITMQPDPPQGGRILDVYTQKGGISQGSPGGDFFEGEEVLLMTNVTYNGAPVSHKLVVFEVRNALDETVIIRTAFTDAEGIAYLRFRIPYLRSSYGTWTVMSKVDIAERGVWDVVTFEVHPISVGGYSYVGVPQGSEHLAPYVTFLTIFTAGFLAVRKKRVR